MKPAANPLPTEASIRDADLLAALDSVRGKPEFTDLLRYLAAKQHHRDNGLVTPLFSSPPQDAPHIHDPDLRERLSKIPPGDQFHRMMRDSLVKEQKIRDEKAARLAKLTPVARPS